MPRKGRLTPALLAELAAFPGIASAATTRSVDVTAQLTHDGDADRPAAERAEPGSGGAEPALPRRHRRLAANLAGGGPRQRAHQRTHGDRYGLGVGDTLFIQTDRGLRPFPLPVSPWILMCAPRRSWPATSIGRFGTTTDLGHCALCGARRGCGRQSGRDAPGLCRARWSCWSFPTVACAKTRWPSSTAPSPSPWRCKCWRRGGLHRHLEHADEPATGADARDRRAACDRHDAAPALAALAVGDGADGRHCRVCWRCRRALCWRIILIYIINLRSFGWTLEMRLQPMEFVQAFLVALWRALLAGIYPAWKMGQTQPAVAVTRRSGAHQCQIALSSPTPSTFVPGYPPPGRTWAIRRG